MTRRATLAALLASAAVGGTVAAIGAGTDRTAAVEPVDDGSAILLRGPGIDPTGARDSRAAVQALLDAAPAGSTIVNPSGAVLRLDGGLTVRKPFTRLTGSGEWRFRAGGAYGVDPEGQNGFLDLRANSISVDGIHATNPDAVLNRGIVFLTDQGSITGCTLVGFGQGITVSPAGEYHSFTISGNHVLDVLGSGGGPKDTSRAGEDYGDGIVCWGAAATITGNVVSCKDGRDARIGVHVEGLDDQARVPWVHDHRMATISGNVITGRFRRGIVSEEVHHVAITGNTIADATWWSIALISAQYSVVADNTLLYTRTAADTQGSAWGPFHAAITLYGIDAARPVLDPIVADNTILVAEGAEAGAGIAVLGNDANASAVVGGRIAGNRIVADGALQSGVFARESSTDLEVASNRATGWRSSGIWLSRPTGAQVRANTAIGPGRSIASTVGIAIDRGSRVRLESNTVRAAATGIAATDQVDWTVIRGTALVGVTTGVDTTGSSGVLRIGDTVADAVGTQYRGLPTGTTPTGDL